MSQSTTGQRPVRKSDPIPADELADTREFPTVTILDDGPNTGYGQAPDEHWYHPHARRPSREAEQTRGPTADDWAEFRAHMARVDQPVMMFGYE